MNLVGNVFLIEDNGVRYISQNGKRVVLPKRIRIYVAKWDCVQLSYRGSASIFTKSFTANKDVIVPIKDYLNNIIKKDVMYEHEAMPKTLTTVRVSGYPPLVTLHHKGLMVYNPFTKERTYVGVKSVKSNTQLAKDLANSLLETMNEYKYTKAIKVITE